MKLYLCFCTAKCDWRFEMSVEEKVAAGRWKTVGNRSRYLRVIAAGDGAVARLYAAWKAAEESGPETGPEDVSSEM